MEFKRFTTINDIDMIQCGDYNWEILIETDGTEVYEMHLWHPNANITLQYGQGNFVVSDSRRRYSSEGGLFIFKMKFENTHELVKALLLGEECTLMPIAHKDTVKIK